MTTKETMMQTAATAVDDLAEYLERAESEWDLDLADAPDPGGEFVITTLEQATWAARVVAGAQAKVDEIRAAADAERARIAAWEADASRRHHGTIDHLSAMLRYFHETRHREDGGEDVKRNPSTSVKLPHGVTLKSRKQQPAWTVEDAEAFTSWARVHAPDYVKRDIVFTPKLADLKAAVKAEGVDVKVGDGGVLIAGVAAPGVKVEERQRKFDVAIGG
jgi:hypothetical protein